jgi:hypothetical protein
MTVGTALIVPMAVSRVALGRAALPPRRSRMLADVHEPIGMSVRNGCAA